MKRFIIFVYGVAIIVSSGAQAVTPTERLAKACRDLVTIYEKREQKSTLARWTTSVADELHAGYCRGVVEEYRRNRTCRSGDWHEQAKRIAELSPPFLESTSVNEMLEGSCAL